MNALKPYLKPLLIIGIILILTVIISWFAFPTWRTQQGGIWLLLAAAVAGVVAITKDALSIAKTLKELNAPARPPQPAVKPPHQDQRVRNSKRVKQSGKRGAAQSQNVTGSEDVTQEIT